MLFIAPQWIMAIFLPEGINRYQRISGRGEEPEDKNSVEWVLWRYSCVLGLDTREGCISTGNSSYGALGLAYHLVLRMWL